MRNFLLGWLLGLGGAAIALIVAALVFEGFELNLEGFVGALLIFGILNALLPLFILRTLAKHAGSIVPLTGLISTLVALLITDAVTDGLNIGGVGTLLGSALLVWVLSMFMWLIPGPWRKFQKGKSSR